MTPAHHYEILQTLILRARALGTASEAQVDALLDEMDGVWDAMTPEEQRSADLRAAALARIPAPDDLHLDADTYPDEQ